MKPMTIWAAIANGMFLLGRGISSARWETQSGVPTAKAPLSMPARKTNPLLSQPVAFWKSAQTKVDVACGGCDGEEPGSAAHTMMVTKTPPMMKKRPRLLMVGRERFMNMTVLQQSQDIIR